MPNNNPAAAARSTLAKARSEIAFGLPASGQPRVYPPLPADEEVRRALALQPEGSGPAALGVGRPR